MSVIFVQNWILDFEIGCGFAFLSVIEYSRRSRERIFIKGIYPGYLAQYRIFSLSLHSISCSLENLNSQLSVKKLRGPSVKSFVSKANTKLHQNRLEVSQNIHYYYMLQGGYSDSAQTVKYFRHWWNSTFSYLLWSERKVQIPPTERTSSCSNPWTSISVNNNNNSYKTILVSATLIPQC